MKILGILVVLILAFSPLILLADVVYFDNGDRLSGDIASLIDNKLTLENTPVGKIEVDTANVKTFSTDEPIDIYFLDGESEKKVVEKSDEGRVAVKTNESDGLKQVKIGDIYRIGPLDNAVVWSGNVRSGLNGSNGNSDTLNFNVGLNLRRRSLRDRATLNGEYIFQQSDGEFKFQAGPVFAQLVLADEVNRATPKAQSALLEAMEEQQVSVDGQTHVLPEPFYRPLAGLLSTNGPSPASRPYLRISFRLCQE